MVYWEHILLIPQAIPGFTFCLGCWQVYRWQWKLDLISALEEKVKQVPVSLPRPLQ